MPLAEIKLAFQRKPAFMPYLPVGYPTLADSIDALEALGKNGADLIEVGIPFSDPLADGPVIQQATHTALENGVTLGSVFDALRELRRRGVAIPLILMGYYNPIFRRGLEAFRRDALAAGADGVIVPDLPPEESGELEQALGGDFPCIRMLAPTTSADRAQKICASAKGFLYLVSVTGVTGARDKVSAGLPEFIARVRGAVPQGLPLCVGFGIASPAQAAEVGRIADGVIVGSACVRALGEAQQPKLAAANLARAFRAALKGIGP
ncbi:MAG: tryptophan synthase subunit alpha [Anaerolineales bacterium]|nr:tryptophan synthase subunit alpha [Anaerolineales bacterium]